MCEENTAYTAQIHTAEEAQCGQPQRRPRRTDEMGKCGRQAGAGACQSARRRSRAVGQGCVCGQQHRGRKANRRSGHDKRKSVVGCGHRLDAWLCQCRAGARGRPGEAGRRHKHTLAIEPTNRPRTNDEFCAGILRGFLRVPRRFVSLMFYYCGGTQVIELQFSYKNQLVIWRPL